MEKAIVAALMAYLEKNPQVIERVMELLAERLIEHLGQKTPAQA